MSYAGVGWVTQSAPPPSLPHINDLFGAMQRPRVPAAITETTVKRRHRYTAGQKDAAVCLYEELFESSLAKGKMWCAKEVARRTGADYSCVMKWAKPYEKEKRRCVSNLATKRIGKPRPALFPSAENKLLKLTKARIGKCLVVKSRWLRKNMREIVCEEKGPDVARELKLGRGWMRGLKKRKKLSWRKSTKKKAKPVAVRLPMIRATHLQFYKFIHEEPMIDPNFGRFPLRDRRAMDEIPFPFSGNDGYTWAIKGSKDVHVKQPSDNSNKRFCSGFVTFRAEGEQDVGPMVIFRGKGLRITQGEKNRWDPRMAVVFQENAWNDRVIQPKWNEHYMQCVQPCHYSEMKHALLVLDNLDSHVFCDDELEDKHTYCFYTASHCTDMLMPIDQYSSVLKKLVYKRYEDWFETHDDEKVSAMEKRVLFTKWFADGWDEFKEKHQSLIETSFYRTGFAMDVDANDMHLTNVVKRGYEKSYDIFNVGGSTDGTFVILDDSEHDSDDDILMNPPFTNQTQGPGVEDSSGAARLIDSLMSSAITEVPMPQIPLHQSMLPQATQSDIPVPQFTLPQSMLPQTTHRDIPVPQFTLPQSMLPGYL